MILRPTQIQPNEGFASAVLHLLNLHFKLELLFTVFADKFSMLNLWSF